MRVVQLDEDKIRSINIEGTENVIRVCVLLEVPRLIYASTVNVVFGGQEIINGTEGLPYFPTKQVFHCSFLGSRTLWSLLP